MRRIRIIGQLLRQPGGALAQSTFGQSWRAPGDALEEGFLMFRPNLLAKQLQVFLGKRGHDYPPQVVNFTLGSAFCNGFREIF
jgi:hypothetical protein